MRIQFVPVTPKVPKYRATKREKTVARNEVQEFWDSLPESEKERFRNLKGML